MIDRLPGSASHPGSRADGGGRRVLLMDRDGTINRSVGRGRYVGSWEEFDFREDTVEAMRHLAQDGFEFIVITNQAGIASGALDPRELESVHRRMVAELEREGITILDVYMCPDPVNSNSLRRKPAPGMFLEAAADHDLDLARTLYVGDDPRDCLAAMAAGCGMVFLAEAGADYGLPPSENHRSIHGSLLEALDEARRHYGVETPGGAP